MGFESKKKKKKKTGNRARSEGLDFLVCFIVVVSFFLLPKPTKTLATSTVPLEETIIIFIRFYKG